MMENFSTWELPKSHTRVDPFHLVFIRMENWVIWLAENCRLKEWKPIEASRNNHLIICSFPDNLLVVSKQQFEPKEKHGVNLSEKL